jgi:hypothetical protein
MGKNITEEDRRYHIAIGVVSLYVNRNANIWSNLTMYLSSELRSYPDIFK